MSDNDFFGGRRRRRGNGGSGLTLFSWVVGEGASGGTFARTGDATYTDGTLALAIAGTGVARTAHYVTPTGASAPIQTLLLEPQRTNLVRYSEQLNDATWTKTSSSVTANAATAPDGTLTADLLTASGATNGRAVQTITFTGNGTKCASVFVKQGSATVNRFVVRDNTAGSNLRDVLITWTAGVPAVSSNGGSGTIYPVVALANGWYRILIAADSAIAVNSNQLLLYPDHALGTGTCYFWGAQVENAIVPSSYIKTEATTVTRNADSLYFPFTAPPQAMTVYARSVNRGLYTASTSTQYAMQIGPDDAVTDPRFVLYVEAAGTLGALYDDGTTQVTSTSGSAQVLNTIVEHLGQLSSDWKVTVARAYDGGAVTTGTQSASSGASVAWSSSRLYLTNTTNLASVAFTHVIVAAGEQTMATMRSLAGVA